MQNIKKSIIAKNIDNFKINKKIRNEYLPKAGDVAIFQVISIGKHTSIQGVNGNNTYIFPGDKILATFGSRYASAQFEGYVPKKHYTKYQLLGQGGVVGVLASMHAKFEDIGPTQLRLLGYAVDAENKVINTIFNGVERKTFNSIKRAYEMYLSVGASMDSGKTTTAAYLCRGLINQKRKVAFIKLTGTVFAKDCSIVRDCGAKTAVDFSYCGYPSTFLVSINELLDILETLLNRVERINPDVVVIEIADGLLQRETKALINYTPFMNLIDGVLLSCADSLSINSGIEILSKMHHKPIVLSGVFTASPLMVYEVKKETSIPVFSLDDFMNKITFGSVFPNVRSLISI